MSDAVRVRFAPSPTGMFLSAGPGPPFLTGRSPDRPRQLVLRIEDTDAERNRLRVGGGNHQRPCGSGSTRTQFEGPYFQSAQPGPHARRARGFTRRAGILLRLHAADIVARTGDSRIVATTGTAGTVACAMTGPGAAAPYPRHGAPSLTMWSGGKTVFPSNAIEDFVLARGDGTTCSCWPMPWMTSVSGLRM